VLEEFEAWMKRTYPDDVKVVITFADYIKQMNKAYNGGADEYYAIPGSDNEIFQYVEIYSWSGDVEEDFRNIVTPDYRRTHINGRFSLKEFDDGTFSESSIDYINDVINAAARWLEQRLPEGVTVQPYGVLPMWKQVQIDIIEGQFYAIAIAMCAILVVLTVLFRSLAVGLISLTPVATAVAAIFGLMGWLGIKLEIGTSLVAAMAIGIGIDDTMYFLLTYRKFKGQGQGIDAALLSTFEEAGKAIMYTSFALMAGYSILLLSKFKVIQYFAMLNFVAIVATTVGALVILPLILRISDHMTARGVVKV
jgi:predicted RND superfamily exporter protein